MGSYVTRLGEYCIHTVEPVFLSYCIIRKPIIHGYIYVFPLYCSPDQKTKTRNGQIRWFPHKTGSILYLKDVIHVNLKGKLLVVRISWLLITSEIMRRKSFVATELVTSGIRCALHVQIDFKL